jgi:RNA polymerase sigma-70 factor (ECF subfamily)
MDKSTLQALGKGNDKAYQDIYNAYFTRVGTWAAKFMGTGDELEDVVQEVFISLWTRRETFATAENFNAYLYASTKNVCMQHLKERGKNDDPIEVPAAPEAENAMKIAHLETAIESLPEKLKDVVRLHVDGFDQKEIGQKLGYKPQTVFNYVRLGTKALKGIIYSKERKVIAVKPTIEPTPIPVEHILDEVKERYFKVLFAQKWYLGDNQHKKKSDKPMTRSFWVETLDGHKSSWRFTYVPADTASIELAIVSARKWMNRTLDKLLIENPLPIMRLKR